MKIAVIGAGFGGLAAAYEALKQGLSVALFERDPFLGGLAAGMRGRTPEFPAEWEWDLELFYHHWFTNDDSVFALARDIGAEHKIITKRPISSILYNDKPYPFDSPVSLLTFPYFNPLEKARVAYFLASLKYFTNMTSSQKFERITAHEYIPSVIGQRPYQILFEPLLQGKFGEQYKDINMRWFWARIYKRTPSLAYYHGGFSAFASDIAGSIQKLGGTIHLATPVEEIRSIDNQHEVIFKHGDDRATERFDRIIVTTPPFTLKQLIPNLPVDYATQLTATQGLAAYVLILALRHEFMNDGTYWLNINQSDWPFLAVVEHTHLIDKCHYNNENLLYVGNYVDPQHRHMSMSKEELLAEFTPFLKRINPLFSPESIIRSFHFKTPYAQPIVRVNHEANILPLQTPVDGIFLASMAQVYPWDRGTNYAIELGRKVVPIATK